jgi:hypothetical protein
MVNGNCATGRIFAAMLAAGLLGACAAGGPSRKVGFFDAPIVP